MLPSSGFLGFSSGLRRAFFWPSGHVACLASGLLAFLACLSSGLPTAFWSRLGLSSPLAPWARSSGVLSLSVRRLCLGSHLIRGLRCIGVVFTSLTEDFLLNDRGEFTVKVWENGGPL